MHELNKNYFQLFEQQQQFQIDLDALGARYRQLQNENHPDRFANANEGERLRAVQFTSFVNEAYATLKSPIKRAAYLLKLAGVDTERVDQSDLSMDLLMEQMQLRESLSELPADESALPELSELKKSVNSKMHAQQQKFAEFLQSENIADARKLFHEMQFLNKLFKEIEQGEEQRLGY